MADWSRRLRLAAASTAIVAAALAQPACAARDFQDEAASAEARSLVGWVQQTGDARQRPFAVVDKRAAQLYVFTADGRLAGQTPVLLGSAPGDHTAPGVGAHAQSGHVPPNERTTPAGRFEAEPGQNASGEPIIWVDFDSAFAIHRLRPGFSYRARSDRLAAGAAQSRRMSWGCVVVPVAFYQQVVDKVLGHSASVVYVLPETRSVQAFVHALEQR
jgi:hypothetical protein